MAMVEKSASFLAFACFVGVLLIGVALYGDVASNHLGITDPTEPNSVLRRLESSAPANPHLLPWHHGHHFNHSSGHKKPWMHLEVVDGLRNEEVAIFVMSSTNNGGVLLRERIIASSRTWMRFFANVFVVIEDNFDVRYALRHCELIDYDQYTTFACHNEPTYVLSRNCTNEYYNANGICCKVDDTINYLVNVRPDFFKNIKFMLHSDDDTYWRPDQVMRWLASVDNSGANKYPLTANCQFGDDNHKGVWMIENCNEIRTSGWYQPTMFNHAALERMRASSAAYGNRDICNAFIISQDVGVGIYAWMHGVNHIQMPGTNVNGDHKGVDVFTPTDMAVHYIKHHEHDRCDDKGHNGWPFEDRYNQDMVVGCGTVEKSVVGHDKKQRADMYDAWNYYRTHGKDLELNIAGKNEFAEFYVVLNKDNKVEHIIKQSVELVKNADDTYAVPAEGVMLVDEVTTYKLEEGHKVVRRVIPRLMPLRGYRDTQHAKENDITKKWKPFTLNDCSPPGKKQH